MDHPLSRPAAVLTVLALLVPAMQLIIAVHEGGHALAALALGGTVRTFQVNMFAGKPRLSYSGLSRTEQAVVTAAGPGLTLLLWLAWLLAVRGERSAWHRKLLFVGSFGALVPLIVWSVFPLLYANGRRLRDDSVIFIRLTGANPYVVSSVSLLLFSVCIWLYLRRSNVSETMRAGLTPIVSTRFHVMMCWTLLALVLLGFVASRS